MNYWVRRSLLLSMLFGCCSLVWAQPQTTTIDTSVVHQRNAKTLLGVTFDARTGMTGNLQTGTIGYFDAAGNLLPNLDTQFDDFPINGIRYPGNGIGVGFQWQKAIGPTPRPPQNILGGLGAAAPVDFGFDEFMAYVNGKGLTGEDVQIMVSIYDSLVTYDSIEQNWQRIPYPAQSAADWVEYANGPSDGSNWGGGIDWAARRDSNGHHDPYGIRIWNIGNEPWTDNEFDQDTAGYWALAKPIIDSMMRRDPSIHITLPTLGNGTSRWNRMAVRVAAQTSRIYGVSPHFFQTGTNLTAVQTVLTSVVDSMNAHGLHVILGDFSHQILSSTNANIQSAMAWKGASYTTDALLMLSQLDEIERANHWTFGNVHATWRPIRRNAVGDYTLMPVAQLYKILTPYFLPWVIGVTTNSPPSSDGVLYSVRASAFANPTKDTITVIAINRDTLTARTHTIAGLNGYTLIDSTLLTATHQTAETITQSPIARDINGNFALPRASILLLKYAVVIPISVEEEWIEETLRIHPNPAQGAVNLNFGQDLDHARVEVLDMLGRVVVVQPDVSGKRCRLEVAQLARGSYLVRVQAVGYARVGRLQLD